ncbi:MAG: histidine kinase [Lewinellaceae bacterium]|nr:histidine kinase [Lewinellaceae bacterium]
MKTLRYGPRAPIPLFLVMLAAIFFRNLLLKREDAYQRLSAEYTRERIQMEQEMALLREATLRAQINPHFIFNCLNAIQSFILDNDRGRAVSYLSRFAQLIRLTLNCSLEQKVSLEDELQMLHSYLELEKMRFKNNFDYQIEVADGLNTFDVSIPPLLIQPYVENAIVHGLAHNAKRGLVRISYEKQDGHLLATVTDNGIGLEASKRRTAVQAALHRSVGMTITRKRLELLSAGKQYDVVSAEELSGADGEVQGTRVQILIRLDRPANS